MPGSLHSTYLDGGWYDFDGFAIVLNGPGGRIEVIPSGLLNSVPHEGPDSHVSLVVRVIAEKFVGETTVEINVPALHELHDQLQQWDADGNLGICWEPAGNFGIRIEAEAGTRAWLLRCRLSESQRGPREGLTASLATVIELDRGSIEAARQEAAAVIRCIRSAAS